MPGSDERSFQTFFPPGPPQGEVCPCKDAADESGESTDLSWGALETIAGHLRASQNTLGSFGYRKAAPRLNEPPFCKKLDYCQTLFIVQK